MPAAFLWRVRQEEKSLPDHKQPRRARWELFRANLSAVGPAAAFHSLSTTMIFRQGTPQRMVVQTAINMWNGQTFAPLAARTDEGDYVRFREASANLHSKVGRQGGEQGVYCDIGRSSQKLIPDQKSKAAPALAATPGVLHMVHLGNSSNDLWHSTFDGSPWTTNVKIPDQKSKASPALAFFNGAIHMVHLGNSSNDLWHSVFNGTSWSTNVTDSRTRRANRLRRSPSSAASSIWFTSAIYRTTSGTRHSTARRGRPTSRLPARRARPLRRWLGRRRLHLVHLDYKLNKLRHATSAYRPAGRPELEIPNQKSKAAPALAAHNRRRRERHASHGSPRLQLQLYLAFCLFGNGSMWSEQYPNRRREEQGLAGPRDSAAACTWCISAMCPTIYGIPAFRQGSASAIWRFM